MPKVGRTFLPLSKRDLVLCSRLSGATRQPHKAQCGAPTGLRSGCACAGITNTGAGSSRSTNLGPITIVRARHRRGRARIIPHRLERGPVGRPKPALLAPPSSLGRRKVKTALTASFPAVPIVPKCLNVSRPVRGRQLSLDTVPQENRSRRSGHLMCYQNRPN
jgi:hypothetical protein